MQGIEVAKRCVFALTGYEPVAPARQHERFVRELRRFERTWNLRATVSPMTLSPDMSVASWHIETEGPNWRVETDYHSLRWDDLVEADFRRSDPVRWGRAAATFADFLVSGAAVRYFAVSWRYGLFLLYPLLLTIAFAGAAAVIGWAATGFGLPVVLAVPVALGSFFALVHFSGPLLLLAYIFDDWIFAGELVHRSRPEIRERLERFVDHVAAALREGGYDEIVISGHSLGAALKIVVADGALQRVRDFGARGERLHLLSSGSSLLKIALHPGADWLRQAVARVSAHRAVFWVEYQSMVDVISFYKTNPVTALNLPETGRPVVRRVHIRDMLADETYRRFRGNFFRLHRQLVMGNDKRYFYDFYMVCCGPFRLDTRVTRQDDMIAAFDATGALVDTLADLALRARGP
jgi:hypothetical protein